MAFRLRVCSGVLLVILIILGSWISSRRELWNDEYFSAVSSTFSMSYGQILGGKVAEGNNSPLFYLLQKIQCQLFSYQLPQEWAKGQWEGKHEYDQVFLRIQPVCVTALALAILFYYFARRYSWQVGAYALFTALSSFMIWDHWAEARPYSLWFALSIVHVLLLLELLGRPQRNAEPLIISVIVLHMLLALTATLSIFQIIAASVLIGYFSSREWKQHVFLILLPLAICIFYYVHAPKYSFFFADGPVALFSANFPKDRWLAVILFLGVFSYNFFKKRTSFNSVEWKFFVFLFIVVLFNVVLLIRFLMGDHHQGFQISNRYFMPLTALGIISTTLFGIYSWSMMRSWRTKLLVGSLLFLLLIFRAYTSYESTIRKIFQATSVSKVLTGEA